MDGLSPQQKLETNLLEMEGDIRLKKKEHDQLLEDLERLQDTKDSQIKQNVAEILILKKKKHQFAIEVKKLTKIFSALKERKIDFKQAFELFAKQEIAVVSEISREVLDDLYSLEKRSKSEAKKVSRQRKSLDELSLFLTTTRGELRDKQNELTAQNMVLADRESAVAKNEGVVSKQAGKTKNSLLEATRAREEAQTKLKKADFTLEQAENRKKKVDKTLNSKEMRLKSHSKVLQAEKRGLASKEKELKKKAIWLEDKEKTLQRAYEEVKAKAKKLGIVI